MTGIATLPDRVRLDGGSLTVEDVVAVAREDAPVEIADAAREAVRTSRGRVEDVLDSDEAVYGITTGFGELVDERIPRSAVDELQADETVYNALGEHIGPKFVEAKTEEHTDYLVDVSEWEIDRYLEKF